LGIGLFGLNGSMSGSGELDVVEIREESHPDTERKLAVIEIDGVLLRGGGGFGKAAPVDRVIKLLELIRKDDEVAGLLIRLNTPGGGVTTSDIMHNTLKRLSKTKKVIVLMGDICASGGYYVAVAAHEIWAHPTSLTGSIGVLINSLSVKDLLEKHGIKDQSVVSGANKQILSPTRELSDVQRDLLSAIIKDLYDRFVRLVAEGRSNLNIQQVIPHADGRIFTASQAKKAGLIDKIGYRHDALGALKKMVGGGPLNVVRYERRPSFFDAFVPGTQLGIQKGVSLEDVLKGPRAYYLFGGMPPVRKTP